MKIVAVEPIGISEERAGQLAKDYEAKGHEFVVYPDRREDEATLVGRMEDAEVVIVSNIRLSQEVLSQCPKLKFLNVAFTGLDHIALDYCRQSGIEVRNAAGYATEAVAELAVGMMLDLLRRITPFDLTSRALGTRGNVLGRELRSKTVGIVGTGAIGLRTIELLRVFGCKIIACSRTKKAEAEKMGAEYVSLAELMQKSDIISLHTPLTAETRGLISREMLAFCRPSTVIVNTARGAVVDAEAVCEMLNTDRLAGYATDVYESEPPINPNSPLLEAKNTLLLPHVAFATRESFDKRIDIVLAHLDEYLTRSAK